VHQYADDTQVYGRSMGRCHPKFWNHLAINQPINQSKHVIQYVPCESAARQSHNSVFKTRRKVLRRSDNSKLYESEFNTKGAITLEAFTANVVLAAHKMTVADIAGASYQQGACHLSCSERHNSSPMALVVSATCRSAAARRSKKCFRCLYKYLRLLELTNALKTLIGTRNEYQPMGADILRLGSKCRYGSRLLAGDPLYNKLLYLSASEVCLIYRIRRYTNPSILYFVNLSSVSD